MNLELACFYCYLMYCRQAGRGSANKAKEKERGSLNET